MRRRTRDVTAGGASQQDSRLLFVGPVGESISTPLWAVRADGSGLRRLATEPPQSWPPFETSAAISPDGATLYRVPHLVELNIGHSIVSRAVFTGLDRAVKDMLALMKGYRS